MVAANPEIDRLARRAELHLARRLTAPEADRLALYRIETDLVEAAKRVFYFSRRTARRMLEVDMPEGGAEAG